MVGRSTRGLDGAGRAGAWAPSGTGTEYFVATNGSPNNPGSLSQAESVDILTYLLWYNGLPIGGVPLSTEQTVLTTMTFQTPALTSE